MFKELYPIAQSSPLAMHVSVEGDKLRVSVQQKTSKKGPALSLTVIGTPDELDAELATTIEAEATNGSAPSSVAAQVRAQLANGGKTAAKPADPAPAANGATPAVPKPGTVAARKQECLDDYVKLATDPKNGSKLNREYFIEKAKTGRNFERLYGNWTKFKTAGDRAVTKAAAQEAATSAPQAGQAPAGEGAAVVDDTTLPLLPEDDESAAGASDAEAATAEPIAASAAEPEAPPPPPARVWRVQLVDGTLLFEGTQTREPAISNELDHAGTTYRIVGGTGEYDVIVVRPKLMNIELEDGTVLGADMGDHEPGAAIDVKGVAHTVLRAEARRYIVSAPKVRKIVDEEGETLGTHTGDVEVDAIIDANGSGKVKVLRVTEKAIFVVAATPVVEV